MTGWKIGQRLRTQPSALDEDGAGVARLPEGTLHVQGALAGELVEAEVQHVSPHLSAAGGSKAWAHTLQILSPSAERVAPACPGYGDCGGCPLQHLAYEAQLVWKRAQVEAALAGVPGVAGLAVSPCLPSPRPLGYRNQAKYVYGRQAHDGRLILGAYRPRSHDLVDLQGCRVVEPVIDEVAVGLRAALERAAVEPYDERRETGLLRYVLLRANARQEVLVTLVTARPLPGGEALAEALRAACPTVVGVVQSLNAQRGNVIFASPPRGPAVDRDDRHEADRTLSGQGFVEEQIAGVSVRLGPRAFFQLNREVAALAYREIRAVASEQAPLRRVLDVYAGLGPIAFSLADLAEEVLAVEENPAATRSGTEAAAAAGLGQLHFVTADAAAAAALLTGADLVALNPPRAGAAAICRSLATTPPGRVVYLSCSPRSLARDLTILAAAGGQVTRVQPLDMLPHTPHVETLAVVKWG